MNAGQYKPYPAYKDSGVDRLGEIPVHWEATTLKRIGMLQAGAGFPDDEQDLLDEELPFFKVGDMGMAGNERKMAMHQHSISRATSRRLRAYVFPPNTIVFAKVGAALLLNRRRLLVCHSCIDNNMMGFMSDTCDPIWAMYWLSGLDLGELANPGAVPSVNESQMRSTPAAVPKPFEQRAIAAFLDRETARIDALVAKKERLIELLQEKRTALITRAVTKGLDPTVPMKDSGVEWLGEIPAHWQVAPVYTRYEVALGKMLDSKRVTGEFPGRYLRNIDVQWDAVNVDGLPEMDFALWERDRYLLQVGDLLVCEGGEIGRTAIWEGQLKECFYQKAIHRLRPRSELDTPRLFYYLMYALAKLGVFTAGGNPNTIDHLTAVQLRHYRMPFPSRTEQHEIVTLLDREAARIDALVSKVLKALERLKEYRTALISAAVTGKIDVREEVP